MADPWNFTDESASLGYPGQTVTLLEGRTFCISDRSGDIHADLPHGLFFRDTRLISRLELSIDGQRPESLTYHTAEPFSATFVSRVRLHRGGRRNLVLFRRRYIGRGMREDLQICNFGGDVLACTLSLDIESDFADLFEVKEGRVTPREHAVKRHEDSVAFLYQANGTSRGMTVTSGLTPTEVNERGFVFDVKIPPDGSWSTCFQAAPEVDGNRIEPRFLCGAKVELANPRERLERWRRETPILRTDYAPLREVVEHGLEDIGSLRLFDPEHPDRAVVAAGAPWFMTLFGRDSLIASWMSLLADPELALGVLQTLAGLQGEEENPLNEEEPGRILHEIRLGDVASSSLGGSGVYYGTVDATPLFVMLLGELRRWGIAEERVDSLLPHAERALEWIDKYGDRNGDGFVDYQRPTERGLVNQGWKDSPEAVRFADGRLAEPPIALAEVQGYVYGAYLARVHFATEVGDWATAERFQAKASDLKRAFNKAFWLPDRGWFAMALDGDKQPVDALASNMGHCLWTGIVDEDKASSVAEHLVSEALFSGWGIRTLATSMAGYDPLSYHCGSVWPHDTAIAAAGLMRYGFVKEAQAVIMALLDVGREQGGRLPELISGIARAEFPTVVSYPTSCSPQAWASASPLLLLRTLLRLDPWVPHHQVWLAPALPDSVGYLRVERIPLAGGAISVEVNEGKVDVQHLPPEIELCLEPRDPGTGIDR